MAVVLASKAVTTGASGGPEKAEKQTVSCTENQWVSPLSHCEQVMIEPQESTSVCSYTCIHSCIHVAMCIPTYIYIQW